MPRLRTTLLLLAVLLMVAPAGWAGRAPRPARRWMRLYLQAIDLEQQSRWLGAAEYLRRAIRLQPKARRNVELAGGKTVDYAPYAHMAYSLARAGVPRPVVEPILEKARESGVAPADKLENLARLVAALPEKGTWPPPKQNRRRPTISPEGPESPPSAAPTVLPTPRPTALPLPTPTPRPAVVSLPLDAPPGLALKVDGTEMPVGRHTIEVAAGRHTVEVVRDGDVLLHREIELAAGQLFSLAPVIERVTPAPETASPTAAPLPARNGSVPSRRAVAGLALTAGLILAAAFLMIRRRSRRPDERRDSVSGARTVPSPDPTGSAKSPTPPTSLSGRTIRGYRLGQRLGSGGMATTYRAERVADGRQVALKIPHEHCLEDESSCQRFLREGKLGEELHHPNIVRVLEAGEDGGWPFLAMELVEGHTLRALLRSVGEMPLERALEITRQVAEALDYAHAKGVIHRDLKPENLMIEADGRIRVMDFGIARIQSGTALTATSMFVGTPLYAAPEAIESGGVDGRADLYALGIVLFEMLEGSAPFSDTTPLEQLRRHLEGDFPGPEDIRRPLPGPVWALIQRLVARNPKDRAQSAQEVLLALRSLQRALEEGRL